MNSLSICIITKNECDILEECLRRIQKHVPKHHEIVVLDTGSTDNTPNMVKKYTDKLYHFQWVDDFSIARNEVANYATHNFILVLDSDEWIDHWNEMGIQEAIANHPTKIGRFHQKNSFTQKGKEFYAKESLCRFYHKKLYHFTGRIHEQITPLEIDNSFANEKKQYFDLPLETTHHSYSGSLEQRKQRSQRNILLLEKELQEIGPDPYLYFQIGQSYYMMESYEEALLYFSKGLEFDVNPRLVYVQNMVEAFGYCLLNTGRVKDALFIENIYEEFAHSADCVFLTGLIYMQNGRFENAIHEFLKATTYKTCKVDGANSYRAYYNAGVIYECTNRLQEAKDCYEKCGDFPEAIKRIEFLANIKNPG